MADQPRIYKNTKTVFDVDGTLLDSSSAIDLSWNTLAHLLQFTAAETRQLQDTNAGRTVLDVVYDFRHRVDALGSDPLVLPEMYGGTSHRSPAGAWTPETVTDFYIRTLDSQPPAGSVTIVPGAEKLVRLLSESSNANGSLDPVIRVLADRAFDDAGSDATADQIAELVQSQLTSGLGRRSILQDLSNAAAIGTSADYSAATARWNAAGLALPKNAITGDVMRAGYGKPNPLMFLLGMQATGINTNDRADRRRAIVFEDAISGLTAAARSGAGAVILQPTTNPNLINDVLENPKHAELRDIIAKNHLDVHLVDSLEQVGVLYDEASKTFDISAPEHTLITELQGRGAEVDSHNARIRANRPSGFDLTA